MTEPQKQLSARVRHWIKTQHGSAGWEQKLENFIVEELQDQKHAVVMQCYRECLAVECGEGECSRAIIEERCNLELSQKGTE